MTSVWTTMLYLNKRQMNLAIKGKKMQCHVLGVIVIIASLFCAPSYSSSCSSIEKSGGIAFINCSAYDDTVYISLNAERETNTLRLLLYNFYVSCHSNNESYSVSKYDYDTELIERSFAIDGYWSGPLHIPDVSGSITHCELSACFEYKIVDYYFPIATANCTDPLSSSPSIFSTPSTSLLKAASSEPLTTLSATTSTGYISQPPSGGMGHYYSAVLTVPVVVLILIHLCLMSYIRRKRRREKKMRDIRLGVWIQNDVLEHNYAPISINKVVIPHSSSLESFGFCQPNSTEDLKNKAVEESTDNTFSFGDIDFSFKDCHDEVVAGTEKSDEESATEIVEAQSVVIPNNDYVDVNKLSLHNSICEGKKENCATNENYVTTEALSLDLMNDVPLDTSDLPNLLADSVGYIMTNQFSFDA